MKKNLLLFLMIFICQNAYSQQLKWIYKVGGTGADVTVGITQDQDQNLYDITNIMGQVSIGPNLFYQSRGSEGVLIRKSTSLGIRQWVKQLGTPKSVKAADINTDQQNNIYITGTFVDSLYYGNDFILPGSEEDTYSFVIKITSSGNLVWAKQFASNGTVMAKSISVTPNQEVVVSGNFNGEAEFDPRFLGFSAGGMDVFTVKMDANNGNMIFLRILGGINHEFLYKHITDNDGNIYLTGDFRDTLDIDPGMGVSYIVPVGMTDIFLVKLTSIGTLAWGKSFGGIGLDYGHDLVLDKDKNIILTGRFSDTVSFGGVGKTVISQGGTDIFLTKLNPQGECIWVNSFGANLNDQGSVVTTNSNGIIYLGGFFRSKVDFNPSSQYSNFSDSNGGTDGFIATYNHDGTYNDHFTLGGVANEEITDFTLKPNGELVSTGAFGAIVDFDPSSSSTNIFSSGGLDGFMWNVFICINPYIKKLSVEKSILCAGDKVLIRVEEGYLNDATQWSWQRADCNSNTFASGDELNIRVDTSTVFYVKGWGNCVVNDECKEIPIQVFKDSLIYQDIDLCEGDSLIVGDHIYQTTGAYLDTLLSVSGCDSIVFTELNVHPEFTFTQNVSICNGDTVTVGSSIYTQPGNYTDILQTINGCDSIISTVLTVLPSVIDNAEGIICKGDTIRIGNESYTEAGVYIQTSEAENGCTNSLVVTINVLETEFTSIASICEGDSLKVGYSVYTEEGIYTDRLISSFGCDSIITTILSVFPPSFVEHSIEICAGDSIVIGTHVYKTSGFYSDTLSNVFGCDSVIHTGLQVNPHSPITAQAFTICEGDSIIVGGNKYIIPGYYTDTLTNKVGCDSIVETTLNVVPKYYEREEFICEGQKVTVGDSIFSATGTYEISFTNINGCDSIILLNLTVHPTYNLKKIYNICPSDSVIIGNNTYKLPGTYIDTLQTSAGCDSVLTTTIRFNSSYSILNFEICDGENITVNNKKYFSPGIYSDTIVKPNGCDSILTIHLQVHPVFAKDTIFEICKGEFVKVGNTSYYNPGKYTEYLNTNYGCDSIIHFEIRIINFLPIFSVVHDTLVTANLPDVTYQWLICINNEKIPVLGATGHKFAVPKSGSYAVAATYRGCTYISECLDVILSASEDTAYPQSDFNFYPNPVSEDLTIDVSHSGQLRIMSMTGETKFVVFMEQGTHLLSVRDLSPAPYIIEWHTGKSIMRKTFIKI